jgi:hypothetical protein
LIFLAFLLPVAIYLLVLGSLNRRRGPVIVSGTLDLIGLLFAASGFLLCTGPALLSSGYERWRLFWLLGPQDSSPDDGGQRLWMFLAALYFLGVLGGAAYLFWRARATTTVYNVDPPALETALATTCDRLGLAPVRSGNLYVFGAAPATAAELAGASSEGIQASPLGTMTAPRLPGAPTSDLTGQSAVLEVDAFPAMRHVTLRWDPPESPLRQEVEAELERALADVETPVSDLGPLLSLTGWGVLVLTLLAGVIVVLVRVLAQ